MRKVCIFFFSGTGMTNYVVNKIKDEFENRDVHVDCVRIENSELRDIPLTSYDEIGIAYPIHAFNAPKIVVNFVKRLPQLDSMDTFIISTAGEDHAVNYAASDLLIKRLNKKGFKVFYNKRFAMPSNFIVKYDNIKVKHLLNEADKNVPIVVHDLMNRISHLPRSHFAVKILAFAGRLEWYGAPAVGKFFYAKKDCNHCSSCVNNCPNQNIEIDNQSVHFKWHCGLCMRCLYQCSEHAIDLHRPFKFLRFDHWYDPNILR